MANEQKSVAFARASFGSGPVLFRVLKDDGAFHPEVKKDLEIFESWPCSSLTADQVFEDYRTGKCSIVTWHEENGTYIGCTVIAKLHAHDGDYLNVITAVAQPGTRATKRVMPSLIEMAKRAGCKGILIENRRPTDKLWPGFKLLSQSYVLEL